MNLSIARLPSLNLSGVSFLDDSIILAVPHREFIKDSNYYLSIMRSKGFIFDIKNSLPKNDKIIKI